MEKLILSCGRFAPQSGEDTEARVRAMESYLARMSEELEFLMGRLGGGAAAESASALTATGEEA